MTQEWILTNFFFCINHIISLLGLRGNLTHWYIPYIPLIIFNYEPTRWRMTSVSDTFRKQIFDAIKVFRKDKKKSPDGKTIHSYITQHNAANFDENSILNAIKFVLMENLLKNTPTKERDSY